MFNAMGAFFRDGGSSLPEEQSAAREARALRRSASRASAAEPDDRSVASDTNEADRDDSRPSTVPLEKPSAPRFLLHERPG